VRAASPPAHTLTYPRLLKRPIHPHDGINNWQALQAPGSHRRITARTPAPTKTAARERPTMENPVASLLIIQSSIRRSAENCRCRIVGNIYQVRSLVRSSLIPVSSDKTQKTIKRHGKPGNHEARDRQVPTPGHQDYLDHSYRSVGSALNGVCSPTPDYVNRCSNS
jgi:hypothetical protein